MSKLKIKKKRLNFEDQQYLRDQSLLVEIRATSAKVDNLQTRIDNLNERLSKHISLIEQVYATLQSPIDKVKKFFK